MSERRTSGKAEVIETPVAEYEAPRVESVLTSDEIEREAVFGGGISMNP
ncbi:hypothetical protein K2Z84_19305 [Candidatus Binatia bacterium]|jgi:hypothetical protein|nr:hypothetical protein [Candidatus Binatia bacterium]